MRPSSIVPTNFPLTTQFFFMFLFIILLPRCYPYTSQYITLNGVSHHVRVSSPSPTTSPPTSPTKCVVFMHGFSGSTAAFEDAVPILSSEDIMAVAIDRVGFGLTERPESPALPSLPPLPGRDQVSEEDRNDDSGALPVPCPSFLIPHPSPLNPHPSPLTPHLLPLALIARRFNR